MIDSIILYKITEVLFVKKVSVIVPCYNAEKCLSRCINSLVNQTIGIENMELIFVNDASSDNTYQLLCEWEKKYPESILVINCEENGKQGKARNIGLQYATANYIAFADDDDLMEPSMLDILYRYAEKYNCEMAVSYSKTHTIEDLPKITMGKTGREDSLYVLSDEKYREPFLNLDINRAIWNKLYRKEIIMENDIQFLPGYIYDDIYFSALIKHYVTRICVVEQYLYHHIISADSVSYKTDDIQNRAGYFDVNVLLILELRRRQIYEKFANYYETNFFVEYIAFIKSILGIFNYFDPSALSKIRDISVGLFPEYMENESIKTWINEGKRGLPNLICMGLNSEITEEYIYELVKAKNDEFMKNAERK